MKVAVSGRPVEQFDTQVTLPDWQLDNESDSFGGPDNGLFVDPDGNPVQPDRIDEPSMGGGDAGNPPRTGPDDSQGTADDGDEPPAQPEQKLDRKWLDRVIGNGDDRPRRNAAPDGSSPADRPRSPPSADHRPTQ
jgi:penicillin-binding protein 1A